MSEWSKELYSLSTLHISSFLMTWTRYEHFMSSVPLVLDSSVLSSVLLIGVGIHDPVRLTDSFLPLFQHSTYSPALMFKKPLGQLKTSAPIRASDRRKLKQRVVTTFSANPEDGDTLVPDGILTAKFFNYAKEPGVSLFSSCFSIEIPEPDYIRIYI